MTAFEAGIVVLAGLVAGTVNTMVGSGSLLTFPTLLLLGYPPVVANVTNSIGLVPGTLSGVIAYRRELPRGSSGLLWLGVTAFAGGLVGAVLLLSLPPTTFERVVPFLILLASGLMAFQPNLARMLAARRGDGRRHDVALAILIFLTAVYGGYFGAAMGVLFITILAIFQPGDMQRSNALKNVLALICNAIAALLFVAVAPVDWPAAGLIALGAIVGGQIGAYLARRMHADVLRWVVVAVGAVVGLLMLLG